MMSMEKKVKNTRMKRQGSQCVYARQRTYQPDASRGKTNAPRLIHWQSCTRWVLYVFIFIRFGCNYPILLTSTIVIIPGMVKSTKIDLLSWLSASRKLSESQLHISPFIVVRSWIRITPLSIWERRLCCGGQRLCRVDIDEWRCSCRVHENVLSTELHVCVSCAIFFLSS